MKSIKLYGIKYEHSQMLDERFEEYFNVPNLIDGWLFEYKTIIDIIDNHEIKEEYLGIFSWKFPLKTGIFYKKLIWMLNKHENYDVYTFCQKLPKPYMEFSEEHHPGITELVKILCKELNIEYYQKIKNVVYSNFFIAKTEIYREYIETIIKPSIILIKEKYWELFNKDANYKSGIPKEKLKEQIGMEYYNFVTFVLERMFSQFLMNKNYKIKELI